MGVADGAGDVEALGIAGELGDGSLSGSFNFGIGCRGGEILQLQKIAVLQVGIDVETRLHKDIGIAAAHLLSALALRTLRLSFYLYDP